MQEDESSRGGNSHAQTREDDSRNLQTPNRIKHWCALSRPLVQPVTDNDPVLIRYRRHPVPESTPEHGDDDSDRHY